MARRVVLHVGAMKSGTSYLQGQLFTNQDALREQGVLVPGRTWSDQVAAVVDVIGRPRPGQEHTAGSWQRMVDQIDAWPGTAVVSMEFLGPQGPKRIRKVVSSFPAGSVSVVLTVRDLNRSIAAMWQETIQNGRWWTWDEYLAGVEGARPGSGRSRDEVSTAGRTFWRQQNAFRLARNWKRAEGVADLTLVTVPHPGAAPEALMERFGEVIEVDVSPLRPAARANASLDAAATEVLRRTNALLAERDLAFPHGAVWRKQRLAKRILAERRSKELRIGLPVADWVEAQAQRMVRSLQRLDVPHVGDWADLEPVAMQGIPPDDVPAADLRSTAERALHDFGATVVPLLGEDWLRRVNGVTGEDEADLAVRRLAALLEVTIRTAGSDHA